MAPLTWRNVSTPNLGDPIEAMRLSGTLMDRGFSGLSESLGRFNTWRDDQNARLVGDAALRIQDPAELRRQLESGTLLSGMPGGSLTPAAMEALQGRAGTLLAQATSQQALDTARVQDPLRTTGLTLANTRAGQVIGHEAELQPGRVALQGEQIRGARNTNTEFEFMAPHLRGDRERLTERGVVAQPGAIEGIEREAQAARDAEVAANTMRARQLDTANVNDARDYVNSEEFRALSPGAQRAVQDALNRQHPGAFGPVATAVPGAGAAAVAATQAPTAPARAGGATPAPAAVAAGAGEVSPPPAANPQRDPRLALPSPEGTHGTRAGSTYDVTYGNRPTAAPITTMPISDVLTLQEQYVRQHGNSPMGAFQINRDTLREFAPRVLGENWRSIPFTPEVQDRIGRAIFEQRRGRDLTDTWAALPRREAGAYANMTWEQIRGEISRREAPGNGDAGARSSLPPAERAAAALRQAGDIGLTQDQEASRVRGGSLVPRLREAANSTESAAEVAARIRTSFPDETSGNIADELSRLVRQSGRNGAPRLSYAEAGLIMQQNISRREADGKRTPAANWLSRQFGGTDPERGPISTFDAAANDALAGRYSRGELATDERTSRDLAENQTALANARARVEAARAEVAALREQVAGGRPQLQGSLDRAEERLGTAADRLQSVNDRLSRAQRRVAEAAAAANAETPSRRGDAQAATPAQAAVAQAAGATGPEGPTRGARVAESRATGTPTSRSQGPGGTARPGTIPRVNVIDENNPEAGMFGGPASAAPGGRQADETGVDQTGLGLALLGGVAPGLAMGARAGAGAAALTSRVLGAGGRPVASMATPVDAMLTRALAAGGRAAPAGAPITQAADMAAVVGTQQGQSAVAAVLAATRSGMSVPEAIALVSRTSGIRPEIITRFVQGGERFVGAAR
jgi:hypothetical protein